MVVAIQLTLATPGEGSEGGGQQARHGGRGGGEGAGRQEGLLLQGPEGLAGECHHLEDDLVLS